jgi:hypothetical protein
MDKKELKELFEYCNIKYPSDKIKAFKKMKLDKEIDFKRLLLLVKNEDTFFLKEKKKKNNEGYFDSVYKCKKGEVLGHAVIYKQDGQVDIDVIKVYNIQQGHGKLFITKIEEYSKLKNATKISLSFDRSCISYCANFYTTVGFLPDKETENKLEIVEGKTVFKKDMNYARMYKHIK